MYNGTCRYYCAFTYCYTGQDYCTRSYPHTIANINRFRQYTTPTVFNIFKPMIYCFEGHPWTDLTVVTNRNFLLWATKPRFSI